MTVTVWIVVNRETGKTSASARVMPPDRIGALRDSGHEVYVADVKLPEWSVQATVNRIRDGQSIQRVYEQRDEWKRRALEAEHRIAGLEK